MPPYRLHDFTGSTPPSHLSPLGPSSTDPFEYVFTILEMLQVYFIIQFQNSVFIQNFGWKSFPVAPHRHRIDCMPVDFMQRKSFHRGSSTPARNKNGAAVKRALLENNGFMT